MKLVLVIAATIFFVFLSPVNVGAQKGWKTYTVDDEYSFQYPSNWKLQERENRFTSIDAKLKYGNNAVQMVFGGGANVDTRTDDEMLEQMKSIVEEKKDGSIFESGIDQQMTNNRTAPYVIATYSTTPLLGASIKMVELFTAIHLPNKVVGVEYLAEENDFDKYLPKVKQIINSISPTNSTG